MLTLNRARCSAKPCQAAARAAAQPLVPVETVNPLMVYSPTFPAQQDVDPELAVAHPALGQIADAHPQRCLIGLGRAVADARPAAPLAHKPVRLLNLVHELASPSRRQSFFASTCLTGCACRGSDRPRAARACGSHPRAASAAATRPSPSHRRASSSGRMSARSAHPTQHLRDRCPVSACFSAKVICSSVNLLFFTALLLPSEAHEIGKLALTPDQSDGGRQRVTKTAGAVTLSPRATRPNAAFGVHAVIEQGASTLPRVDHTRTEPDTFLLHFTSTSNEL